MAEYLLQMLIGPSIPPFLGICQVRKQVLFHQREDSGAVDFFRCGDDDHVLLWKHHNILTKSTVRPVAAGAVFPDLIAVPLAPAGAALSQGGDVGSGGLINPLLRKEPLAIPQALVQVEHAHLAQIPGGDKQSPSTGVYFAVDVPAHVGDSQGFKELLLQPLKQALTRCPADDLREHIGAAGVVHKMFPRRVSHFPGEEDFRPRGALAVAHIPYGVPFMSGTHGQHVPQGDLPCSGVHV